jgi:hypothetical protein
MDSPSTSEQDEFLTVAVALLPGAGEEADRDLRRGSEGDQSGGM